MRRDPRVAFSVVNRDDPTNGHPSGRVVEMVEGTKPRYPHRQDGERSISGATRIPGTRAKLGSSSESSPSRARLVSQTFVYLSLREVASLMPPVVEQLDLVEETYRAVGAGRVELPPKPGIHPRPDSFIHAMPAYLRDDDVAALRVGGRLPGEQGGAASPTSRAHRPERPGDGRAGGDHGRSRDHRGAHRCGERRLHSQVRARGLEPGSRARSGRAGTVPRRC